jgi:RimJ/RimL family protein N-acetyltransferase
VICNYIVERSRTKERIGLAVAYEPNLRAGCAYIAFVLAPEHQVSVWPLEALERFVDTLFRSWDFRKLYAEVYEFSLQPVLSGAGKYFDIEGRFRDHEYWDGQYWDLYRLAIYRDKFEKRPSSLLAPPSGGEFKG